MVDVFHQVPSSTMADHLAPVLEWVREGKQPTKATIYQVRSKNTWQLMYQFHQLRLGVPKPNHFTFSVFFV